jgi:hypothetical protein
MTGAHAGPRFVGLPPLQKHPFDSVLIAEARIEGLTLVTPVRHCARRSSILRPAISRAMRSRRIGLELPWASGDLTFADGEKINDHKSGRRDAREG